MKKLLGILVLGLLWCNVGIAEIKYPESLFPADSYKKEQWNEFKKKRVSITDSEIENMVSLRDIARENKNFKEADRIRDELLDKGVLIEDKDGKTLWKFK